MEASHQNQDCQELKHPEEPDIHTTQENTRSVAATQNLGVQRDNEHTLQDDKFASSDNRSRGYVPQESPGKLHDNQASLRDKNKTSPDNQGARACTNQELLAKRVSELEGTVAGFQMRQTGDSRSFEDDDRPDIMLKTIASWKKENIYISKSIKAVKEKISQKDCVCVIGVPGAGKSTAIRYAALSLEKEKGFWIYLISGPIEFRKYYNRCRKQIFVLNDVLGVYSVSKDKIDLWQEHNESIRSVLDSETKLLVSIRSEIFKYETVRDKNFVFLDESVTTDHVDFSHADNKMGIDEMRGMLRHCLTTKGVQIDVIDEMIQKIWPYSEKDLKRMTEQNSAFNESSYTIGVKFSEYFPLLCKVFSNDHARQDLAEFFSNPFPALNGVFQSIKSESKHHFCALVLCAVFDGELNDDMLSPICEKENTIDKDAIESRNIIIESLGLEVKKHLCKVRPALESLTAYVSKIGDTYRMSHTVFHDIVIYLYNDPIVVFKYGKSEFIRDKIRINAQSQDDPQKHVIVYTDRKNIGRLADRLIRDLKFNTVKGAEFLANNPNIDDVILISFLKKDLFDREQTDKWVDELFRQCMLTVCRNNDTSRDCYLAQYKLIELCVDKGADCNMQIRALGRYPLHISVWTGSLQLTQLLLGHGADKRRVVWFDGYSILHWVCRFAKYNKLELIKMLIEHGRDQSVVKFITSDRHRILQELRWYSDILQLEKVLPDSTTEVLTTDIQQMKHYLDHDKGKFQLVRRVHDNILTYVDRQDRNILHYSTDNFDVQEYLLGLQNVQNAKMMKQSDKTGKTPYWYVVNNALPWNEKLKVNEQIRNKIKLLYKNT